MGQFSVTAEELKSQAQVYLQAKDQIEQAIQSVNSMNGTIAQEWKGQAFAAYLDQYNQLYGKVQQFEELLVNINQQINRFADNSTEFDAGQAAAFGL